MGNHKKNNFAGSVLASGALLAALLSGGCGKTQTPEALITEANSFHQKGDDKAAVIQLKNALQAAPENAEARYLLGTIYNAEGDGASAEKELRRALAAGLPRPRVIGDIARALLLQGQHQKLLDETEKDEQGNAGLMAVRGDAYFALSKLPESKQAYAKALELKPDAADALVGMAKCALLEKDMATASRLSEHAIAKNPRNIEVWLFKGDLLRAQGRSADALTAYDESLKLQPNNASARVVKANLEISSGKFNEARVDIEAAKKVAPNGMGIQYTQALLEYNEGKHAAALESIQQVLRIAPQHMPSILLAGSIHYALGSMEQAEQNFKKYLEKNPDNLYARKMLAGSLLKNGQTQRALDVLEPALKSGVQDAQLWLLAGEIYLNAKNPAKATEYLQKADALSPGASSIHTALGMSRLAQGDNSEGLAELEKAVKLGSKSSQANIVLITTQLRLKDYDKALAAAQAMEKSEPKNPLVFNMLGTVYLAKGDRANARSSFEKALALEPANFSAITSLSQMDLTDKKPELAKKRFEVYLATDKKNVQAMTALANIAIASGQKEEARSWLERAVSENPNSVPAARVLSSYYLQNGEQARAKTLVSKLQSAQPGDSAALELLAQTQAQAGDQAAALDSYGKLALLNPESATIQVQIAGLQMAQKDDAAALASLNKAIKLDPANIDAQLALANIKGGKNDFDGALAIAHTLQAQQPRSAGPLVLEGDLLVAKKDPVAAAKAYERAYALNNSSIIIKKLHNTLTLAGKGKEADARLAKWVADHPQDIDTRMYMAQAALNSGQQAAAIGQFESLVKADPKNTVALNNLAWAYQQNRDGRALEYAEKALALAPENPAVLDTAGWILAEKGDTGRALPMLKKALTLAPQALDTRYHLAYALVKSGDKAAARKELDALLNSSQAFPGREDARLLMKQL